MRRWLPPLPILRGPARGLWWSAASARGAVLWHGYEPAILDWFAGQIQPGMVVYDLGAHVGLYTIVAARRGAIVHAFEPDAGNRARLCQHLRWNRLTATVHASAVSHVTGSASWDGSGYLGHLSSQGSPIETVRLDDLALPMPDLIKIDVEGAEVDVLTGGTRVLSARPMLLLATHSAVLDRACVELLTGCGYTLRRLAPDVLFAD